ncbi:DUF3781 domain-containing protein [Furfurilactobacillus sp. WILCCON 0119]
MFTEGLIKKLNAELDRKQIEELVRKSVLSSDKIERHGKNYYVYNGSAKIEITINANNYRVITVNKYIENN